MEIGGPEQEFGNHLARAAEYWQDGVPLEAGRLIFEQLPNELRPQWAAGILKLVLARSGVNPSNFEGAGPKWVARILRFVLATIGFRSALFESVLLIANDPRQWKQGHRIFDELRASLLRLQLQEEMFGFLTKKQELISRLLSLAELVAKVTYNATKPPDPFDEDSGWRIATNLHNFVSTLDDKEFAEAAWSALCFRAQ